MNDILFGNNNKAVITRLTKNSFLANKRRNLFVIIALALTTFMITTVFSMGFSYFDTYQMQQIRLLGTTADVAITNPTDSQLGQLRESNLVSTVGVSQRLGSVETSQLEEALLGLVWLDEKEWETHRLPTISDLQGDYPNSKNEIMLPLWALEQIGISNPQLGMEVPLSFQLGNEEQYTTETFLLSGYYTDYMFVRTDNRGCVYVSDDFKNITNIPLSNGGSAMISFSNTDDVEKSCDKLKKNIGFTAEQEFEIVPSTEANGMTIVAAMSLLIVFIALSGYLLIYNILYISVSKDIRFYGQLKTIGTTERQIREIVRGQVFRSSVIGIPVGLLLGAVISFGVVPYALDMMYSGNAAIGTKISFSPLIFIGAAIFTSLTAIIGSMKPARTAGRISPIAALRYTEVINKRIVKKGNSGVKLYKMAFQNVFRNKKSAFLVFASLFLGLCLFLITTGILSSLSPENFVNQWGESDFAITYSIHTQDAPITEKELSEIRQIDEIDDMRLTYTASPEVTMNVEYDEAVFGDYIKSLEGKKGIDFSTPQKLEAYTQNFFSGIYGIDIKYVEELNKSLEQPIDLERFENGEIVLLAELLDNDGNAVIQPKKSITIHAPNGPHTFSVAHEFLPADFQSGRGKEHGTAPDLYISQSVLKELSSQCKNFRIAFNTSKGQDEKVLAQLKDITDSHPDIEIISRYEKRAEMSGYIITSKVLGTGLSLILLLIGIMNFINTMVVSVNTRKHEFAVLESIGMTKKQTKQVLIYEGICYWGISFALVATLGAGIYIPLYFAFKQIVPYAVFSSPFAMVALIAIITLAVCLIVPVLTYKTDIKSSVVERLRTE